MRKGSHWQPRPQKAHVIEDVAELIVQAAGDESDCLLADLLTIKRALQAAIGRDGAALPPARY